MTEFAATFVTRLNDIWQGGLEAIVGFVGLLGVAIALRYWWLPRYTAVVFHDGSQWLDVPGVWSASRGASPEDIEPFTKYWASRTLNDGKLLSPAQQVRLPVNPKVRPYEIRWFSAKRGIYRVVSVRLLDPEILARFKRRERPVFSWEQSDEEPLLR